MDQWGFTKVSRLKPGWEDGDFGSGAGEGWRPCEVISQPRCASGLHSRSPPFHHLPAPPCLDHLLPWPQFSHLCRWHTAEPAQACTSGCLWLLLSVGSTDRSSHRQREISKRRTESKKGGLVAQKPAVTVRRGASLAVQSWWWVCRVWSGSYTAAVTAHKAACFLLSLSSPSLASFSFWAQARCYAHCALHTRGICTWYKHILQAKEEQAVLVCVHFSSVERVASGVTTTRGECVHAC